jgi:O-antigen ligase
VGSLLAACVATAFWFGAHPTPVRRLLALTAVAAGLLFFLSSHNPTYSQSAFDRIGRFGTGSPDDPHNTLDSRLQGYRIALVRIEADPFVGVGLDDESSQAGTLPVHNIIIGTLYETGVLGLIGLLLIFLSIARMGLAAIVDARDTNERALAIALVSSFLAFLIFLLSEPALYTRYGWVSAALVVALRSVQTKRAEREHKTERASVSSWRPPRDASRRGMLDGIHRRRANRRIG